MTTKLNTDTGTYERFNPSTPEQIKTYLQDMIDQSPKFDNGDVFVKFDLIMSPLTETFFNYLKTKNIDLYKIKDDTGWEQLEKLKTGLLNYLGDKICNTYFKDTEGVTMQIGELYDLHIESAY